VSGNDYFARFDNFEEDKDASLLENFKRLAIQEGWSKKEQERRRPDAVDADINVHFGTDMKKLEIWQKLCEDCGITPSPPSITKCKKVCVMFFHEIVC